jgi:hypothetical protein
LISASLPVVFLTFVEADVLVIFLFVVFRIMHGSNVVFEPTMSQLKVNI